MYERCLDLSTVVKKKSILLLGPRQTGKTTLLKRQFPRARMESLLAADVFREFSARPETLRQTLNSKDRLVIIDEIQKLPALLDEVQLMMDSHRKLRFILTGSSARKLRQRGTNLLAGRLWNCHLHPLVSHEIEGEGRKGLLRLMNTGGLPAIFDSQEADRELKEYIGTYLQEEIRAEALVRSTERFARFLEVSAFCNGELINFSKVGSDVGMPPRTVIEYFRILEDTLVGFLLPPFLKKTSRKAVATSKFYFFDVGVANHLLKRKDVIPGSENFGRALEHLVCLELLTFLDYKNRDEVLSFWRTYSQIEVDFVVASKIAIEVKASSRIASRDEKGLLALREDIPNIRCIIVSNEARYRKTDTGCEIFPYAEFFRLLWAGEIL
jgi:predicted AAA+ superfamily ATPase